MRLSIVLVLVTGLTACHENSSHSKFIPIDNSNRAVLEERDLNDEFGMGISVLAQEGLSDNIIGMASHKLSRVRLSLGQREGLSVLEVMEVDQPETPLLIFPVSSTEDGRKTVDFAGFENPIAVTLPAYAMAESNVWLDGPVALATISAETLRVQQDGDTFVADVRHRVKATAHVQDYNTNETSEVEHEGSLTLRFFLRRLSAVQSALPRVNQGDGMDQNFGFFVGDEKSETPRTEAIQRHAFDPKLRDRSQITFYLKDFPVKYHDIARRAVLAWNKAFGWEAIDVKDAPIDMDIGDPRYNLIRWFESPDSSFGLAGIAVPRFSDMSTGTILSSSIIINGAIERDYSELIAYSEKLRLIDPKLVIGRLGNVSLRLECGETPLLPVLSDLRVGGEAYMLGYYHDTIMHEVGHALGLLHNFKASTEVESPRGVPLPSSIMDYTPRWMRDRMQEIGSYDVAAIRWAYLQEPSDRRFAYCDEDGMDNDIYCNANDFGNPLTMLPEAVRKNIEVLATVPLEFPKTWTSTIMYSEFTTLRKFQKQSEQMPEAERAPTLAAITELFQYLEIVQPAESLSAEERAIVERHLERLRISAPAE